MRIQFTQAKLPSQEYLAGLFLFHPEALDFDWPGNKSCDTGLEFHSNSETPRREIKWIFNQKQNTQSGIHREMFWTLTGLSNMKDCARRLLRKWSWANRMLSKSRVELICCKSCENWDSRTSTWRTMQNNDIKIQYIHYYYAWSQFEY